VDLHHALGHDPLLLYYFGFFRGASSLNSNRKSAKFWRLLPHQALAGGSRFEPAGPYSGSNDQEPDMKKLNSLYTDPDRLVVHACLACLAFLPVLLSV
jgi:hypothetical protein